MAAHHAGEHGPGGCRYSRGGGPEAGAESNGAEVRDHMDNRTVLEQYYVTANAGHWDAWCDLFDDDMIMDEQLAGKIEKLATLRPMMAGMGAAYAKFQNVPSAILVQGDEGAVVSHISALAAKYPAEPIEADVMNYFRFTNGKISYMRNVHDSKPFAPFLRQISEG